VHAADFSTDELLYLPRNPRANRLYGLGPVEQIALTVNIALRRDIATLDYYRAGSAPDAFAALPKEWTIEQIRQFQDYFDALMSGNSARRRMMKFMPSEFRLVEARQPPLKDHYDEWLARVICYAFSVPASAFVSQVNRATSEALRPQATQEGLAPLKARINSALKRKPRQRRRRRGEWDKRTDREHSLAPLRRSRHNHRQWGNGAEAAYGAPRQPRDLRDEARPTRLFSAFPFFSPVIGACDACRRLISFCPSPRSISTSASSRASRPPKFPIASAKSATMSRPSPISRLSRRKLSPPAAASRSARCARCTAASPPASSPTFLSTTKASAFSSRPRSSTTRNGAK
jgi:hypothetical protein